MAISTAIYTLLHQDVTLRAFVGERIYPDLLPKNCDLPAINYTVNNITVTNDKDGQDGWDEIELTVTVYNTKRLTAESVAVLVRAAFNRISSKSIGGEEILTTNHIGESWGFDDDYASTGDSNIGQGVYIQTMDFRIISK